MTKLFLDTETYSETPIKHGTYKYAKNCEVMLVQYALDDGDVMLWDLTEGEEMPTDLAAALGNPEVEIICHNTMFDRNVLRFGARIDIPVSRWTDTMVIAYLHSLPGALATVGDIFKIGEAGKDTEGNALVQLFCKPRGKNTKVKRATKYTHPEKWAQFVAYALQDVVAVRAVYKALPKWNLNAHEKALWVIDQRINDRGMLMDTELAEAAVKAVTSRQNEVKAEVFEVTREEVASATQRDAMLDFIIAEYGINLPDLKKANVEQLLGDPDIPTGLKMLLQLRRQATTTSTAKYKALLRGVNDDSRLRGTKQFAGAMRTGRWGGRIFQPDNLPRPTMDHELIDGGILLLKNDAAELVFSGAEIMELASSAIRGTIIAPEGKVLAVADLANIEGRAQAWLTGEEWKLQAFRDYDTFLLDANGNRIPGKKPGEFKRKGHDLYNLAYAKSFAIAPENVNKDQRQVGKVQELALGYAGGAGAFATFALGYGIDLDELADKAFGTLDPSLIQEVDSFADWMLKKRGTLGMSRKAFIVCDSFKRLWREAHPSINAYWGELEDNVRAAVANPKTAFYCGKVKIQRNGVWLRIKLPSGRALCYPGIEVNDKGDISYMGVNQFTKKWERIKSFGGKFFENICQAFARDVLAYNMPDIEADGFEIILTVHDEVVAEVEASRTDAHEDLARIMATPKDWCADMPLAAAGFSATRYRK